VCFALAYTLAHRGAAVNAEGSVATHVAAKRATTFAMADSPLSDPLAWSPVKAPSLEEIEVMAEEAFRRLPEKFRALCEGLVIRVEDFPTDEVLDALGAETEYDLLGLFQGVGLPFRSESASGQMPNMIWLYRRPIIDYWAENDESFGAIVTHVLVHEIGHHFGMSDDDMAALEASVT
jgi:predicted Zn-dependent protease with MMP-like domain